MENPEEVLKRAEKRGPTNPFVLSCRNFLTNKGFLSEKQISSLKKVTKPRPRKGYDHGMSYGDVDQVAQEYGNEY